MSAQLKRRASGAIVLALAASATSAATIYRCGDSYSQAPCANGRVVEVTAAATEAERAEARAVAAREKQLALEIVHDRHERERATLPAMAGSLGPVPPAAAASSRAKKHSHGKKRVPRGDDNLDFVATVPGSKK